MTMTRTPLRMCIGMRQVGGRGGWPRYQTTCPETPDFTVAEQRTWPDYATRVPVCQRHLAGVVKNMVAKWGAVVVETFPEEET